MAYQLYIFNDSHWTDAKNANDNGSLTLVGNFNDKDDLEALVHTTQLIVSACFKEDDMAYVVSNPEIECYEGDMFVSLNEYFDNREFGLLVNKLMNEVPTIRKYSVDVIRVAYKTINFVVEADCESNARNLAIEQAENTVFEGCDDADYNAEDVTEIK